jgi:asparagine synthase (glutamine-hydrolysing)
LTRCSSFCITFSDRAEKTAEGSSRSIDRTYARVAREEVTLGSGVRTTAGLTALAFEGSGLPVVHGHAPGVEGTVLQRRRTQLICSRDMVGTRPLYIGRDWLATDHRFFPGEPMTALPPGADLTLATGKVSRHAVEPEPPPESMEEAAAALAHALDASVRERVGASRRVAVAFSGGLDSSLLAVLASRYTKVLAVTVSAGGSLDESRAPVAASALGLEQVGETADASTLDRETKSMSLPFVASRMDTVLWCIYSVASKAAAEAGAEVLMLGQLADELFGGYAKYERAALEGKGAAEAMMKADVADCGMRGFTRDEMACSRWLEPRFPFADDKVVRLAAGMPLAWKVGAGVRKAVLREAAELLGLPKDMAGAPKKAAQYSSGLIKLAS